MEKNEYLLLKNQLCFPLYAASHMVTRLYSPLLKELNLTYPQYLILLVLWEKDNLPVGQLCRTLYLDTNSVTPLLQRMEKKGLLARTRCKEDERNVLIRLTKKGAVLKMKASSIPARLLELVSGTFPSGKAIKLRNDLKEFIGALTGRK